MINSIIGHWVIAPLLSYLMTYFNLTILITDPELYPSTGEFFKHIMFLTVSFEFSFY